VAAAQRSPVAAEATEKDTDNLPQRWAIWLSVGDDLRFASHRDMMRALERLALRAGLGLRFTQGFNPHPILSLIPPRPVGVASRDDLLVVTLDESIGPAALLSALRAADPPAGLTFIGAMELPTKATPQPRRSLYELALDPPRTKAVGARLAELAGADSWPVERMVKTGRGRRRASVGFATRTVDLLPRVADLSVAEGKLAFAALSDQAGSARPGEVLALCGLDERTDLASLVRVEVDYRLSGGKTDFRAAGAEQT